MAINSILLFVVASVVVILWVVLLVWAGRKIVDYAREQRDSREKAEKERHEILTLQHEILTELKERDGKQG
ncbi:hypothetical protein JCM19046_2811 [Bacillus sp. JCM 19046]|nr:hypothetical protein JCM19045_1609 [Bacillus sp. JCM 19045]GAF18247.1 hypothetical protein JCM19046_2811 [Bacillus sp. JCM 19046]